mmetsp:Transcript_25033/g.45913  ORF Transcript_25033/g.45913 Transcript_25033/m.45913 type:complete len:304 (+) Transcript_25033:1053-1964(+)
MPPVPLDSHLDHAHAQLAWQQPSQKKRPLPAHLSDARRWHALQAHAYECGNGCAVQEARCVQGSAAAASRALLSCSSGLTISRVVAVSGSSISSLLCCFRSLLITGHILFCAAPAARDELALLQLFLALVVPRFCLTRKHYHPDCVHSICFSHVAEGSSDNTWSRLLNVARATVLNFKVLSVVKQWDCCMVGGFAGRCIFRRSFHLAFALWQQCVTIDYLLEARSPFKTQARPLKNALAMLLVAASIILHVASLLIIFLFFLLTILLVISVLVSAIHRSPACRALKGHPGVFCRCWAPRRAGC